ncbi:FIGNL1-interacting regulator of recombination and mitosis [Lepisosteus oculatus]|uniref:FIGNL1-interacting regulator of recombination and mitosis n=1 Tax=Lepisosteus oculatus TaxID=7918 RepID=UPI00371EED7E
MSQVTLLEEITQWSVEICQQELRSVLPKLLSIYHHTADWDEYIRVLKILTQMFLPHLSLTELEGEFFSKVLPKVVKMFNDLTEEISNQVGELSSQNIELRVLLRNILQIMVQVLEALSGCVRHICSFEENLASFDSIRSLPSCILKILKNTFQHCKESETAYQGRLSLVADLLQALFKEAYSLQKGFMELLDRISLGNSATEEEVSDMVTVIHSLLDICSVISNLDLAMHANTWKFIVKQSVKYQVLLEDQLRHSDIVSSLCDDVLASFHSCMELAEQMKQSGVQESSQSAECKFFQKTAKICRFFANTLVHYIKEFQPFLSKSCGQFHRLYLQIYSKFPPSLSSPVISERHCNEISNVLVPMDPFITQLLPFRPFAEAVLAEEQQSCPELCLPQCLLLVNILGKLPSLPEDVLDLWCQGSQFPEETPRLSVFQALFLSFQRCSLERAIPILLPGVMMNGQAQSKVTLYQHVCIQLSACIASLPSAHFSQLEHSLLGALLSSDVQTALLATDVWCFLARFGTAELCQHHGMIIAHLIKSCPGDCYQLSHLALLLRRMIFLMTPNHQVQFISKFSPKEAENLTLWQHVLLKALSLDVRKQVEEDIMKSATAVCASWMEEGCKLGQLEKVNTALSAMLSVRQGSGQVLESEAEQSVSRLVTQLWPRISVKQVLTQPALQCTLRQLLCLSATAVQCIDHQVICQALTCLTSLLPLKCPDDIVLAALDLLASLGRLFIPPEIQSQVLPKLSSLFSSLLAEGSWLLHQCTLEAFAQFAEVTNHEHVIPESLASEETKNKVVKFLSKAVHLEENKEERLERLKSERCVIERHRHRLETGAVEVTGDAEPCPKRPRQETCEEEQYEMVLQTAENALKTLQSLTEQTPPPQWVAARLQSLQTQITHINQVKLKGT